MVLAFEGESLSYTNVVFDARIGAVCTEREECGNGPAPCSTEAKNLHKYARP